MDSSYFDSLHNKLSFKKQKQKQKKGEDGGGRAKISQFIWNMLSWQTQISSTLKLDPYGELRANYKGKKMCHVVTLTTML